MSGGNEFHSSDSATGNVRRPTVLSWNGGTSSWSDDDDRSQRHKPTDSDMMARDRAARGTP